ncbi:thermolysin metallopeptidase, catalytic domain protein, partial [Vibrio parahaemolyticus V-223/04]
RVIQNKKPHHLLAV